MIDAKGGAPDRADEGQHGLAGLIEAMSREQIDRRQFVTRAVALGLSMTGIGTVLAACGAKGTSSASPSSVGPITPTKPATPGVLHIFGWSGYLSPVVVNNFEKQTGIKVVQTFFQNNDDMFAKLKAEPGVSGYDFCVTGMDMVGVLRTTGLSQPVKIADIPNFKYVDPIWASFKEDPGTNGIKWSTPWQCGNIGIGVALEKVKGKITNWSSMWDPAYKGGITMSDEIRNALGIGLWVCGYSLNSTSKKELDQATQKLIEQKPLVLQYDENNIKRNMVNGVPLVYAFDANALQAIQVVGRKKAAYVLPYPAWMNWMDNIVMLKGAPNPYAAQTFMNFLLDPTNMADEITYTWYNSPISAAYNYVEEPLRTLLKSDIPTAKQYAYSEHLEDVGDFLAYYDQCWERVMSA